MSATPVTLRRSTTRETLRLDLTERGGVIGSDPGCDFPVASADLAATHARLYWDGGTLHVEPVASAPVSINGRAVVGPTSVAAGDWLAFGDCLFQVGAEATGRPAPPPTPPPSPAPSATTDRPITIGRMGDNTVSIDAPTVSRQHARLERRSTGWFVEDLGSTNGTFVNGLRLTEPKEVRDGDRIDFAGFSYLWNGSALTAIDGAGTVRIEARGLGKVVADAATGAPKALLNSIDLAILPGEFVGIFGTSGSGKSTLMDTLNGRRPGSEGGVFYNGVDLGRSLDMFRSVIGYVPQQDIVHRRITIRRALEYTARLRLPQDTSPTEIAGYIDRVLKQVGLHEKADQPIDTPVPLSGGQLKRVSVAVELVSNPAVLFLDEATSGLDAGTDRKMMQLFAALAADRKTVICVTHTLENIDACHLVVVLFRGRLVYFGPPDGVCEHFAIKRLSDVYETLETKPIEEWVAHYDQSALRRDYVDRRLSATTAIPPPVTTAAARPGRRLFDWRQAGILTRRFADLVLADRRNLAILLAQAPVIGIVVGLVFSIGDTLAARAVAESQIAFMLVVAAVWFGCLNAAREIVKELPIYARERSVNLGIGPYLASKLLPLALLCAIQCVTLLAAVAAFLDIPGSFAARVGILFATGMAASAMGLLVSAAVTTTDKAVAIVPILLIPQVILSNAVVRLEGWSETIAKATVVAFWGFDGMKATLADEVQQAKDLAGKALVPVVGSYQGDLLIVGAFALVFLGATLLALRARDGTTG
jgi:ABC transport system ATP-binding/permease protein